MKKLFFIAWFIVCATSATLLLPSQAGSPVEQLIHIMMSNARCDCPYTLAEKRNPNDYQDVYNLAKKHQKLLKGIIHNGRTFAMLCIERGYADVLERLLNDGCLVDLATPCNLFGFHEPQTTVLHQLLREVSKLRRFKKYYPECYIARITALIELIINKYPDLVDVPVNRARTVRQEVLCTLDNVGDLIHSATSRNLPANDNSVK